MNLSAIDHMYFSEYLNYKNCICKKRLENKLVEECNETIDEVKLTKITHTQKENSYKIILAQCILYCFQYLL